MLFAALPAVLPVVLAPTLIAAAAPVSDFARKEGFAVQQIITADAAQLLRDWQAPDRATQSPTIERIGREQVVDSFIVFTGCKGDAIHRCNVTVDFTLIGPAGQIFAEHSNAVVAVGKAPPGGGALQLSEESLGIFIEPDDPAGDYVVRAVVTDHVAGIILSTERKLTVVEAP
ncbi:hypothetical protein SAMN06295912_101380 [Sphingomonas laterariae]|uniref:Uncharacterized protein n=2 Tax=Edaphosphingomonas laterariae TaxID=861865 RepID=A0A239BSE2_9SPHN|nr:hypothetical protein SAMN06295912_101380 [Sphingomonas laterariae]